MKPVPLLIALWIGTMAGANSAHSQISRQNLSFSIIARYSSSTYSTNHDTGEVTTRETIHSALISKATVVRALAVDLFGADYAKWTGASLLRVTDFTNNQEGIFLYKASPPTYVNVSSNFAMSYLNDFTYEVSNNFNPITNLNGITNLSQDPGYNDIADNAATTNLVFNVTAPIQAGSFLVGTSHRTNTVISTNVSTLASAGLCCVFLTTTNLQFNLIGLGNTTTTEMIAADHLGAARQRLTNLVQTLTVNYGVGIYLANLGTNLLAPDAGDFVSGPAHGTFGTSSPAFATNSAAELFAP
ncbi:MAG: hypothetical protein ABSA47_16880 [Verrucomicrobiota bacterium]|jgi:hypothetical protein